MATDISICSAALLMLNADEITSFDDETREAKLCAALYETTKENILQMHPWRFALGQVTLAKLTSTPLYGFNNAFQLPANTLRVIEIDSGLEYQIYEDMLFTDADTVNAVIQFAPPESEFPAYFTRLMEFAMAELLASALLADESKMQIFERAKLRQMQSARSVDSQIQPTLTFNDNNFFMTNVRT